MKNNKKGFTLAELLIVIAIMAILIAIAIPVFSSQMEKARHAVDDQTERAAKSIAEAHYLLEHSSNTGTAPSYPITMTFKKDGEDNLVLAVCSANATCGVNTAPATNEEVKSQCTDSTASGATDGGVGAGKTPQVTVESDGTVAGNWT